jgi:hypothetical protein
MVVARGIRKIEIWYMDADDTKQHVAIEGDEGGYEIAAPVARIYRGDRTIIVPLSRLIMVDDRLD